MKLFAVALLLVAIGCAAQTPKNKTRARETDPFPKHSDVYQTCLGYESCQIVPLAPARDETIHQIEFSAQADFDPNAAAIHRRDKQVENILDWALTILIPGLFLFLLIVLIAEGLAIAKAPK